MIYLKKFLLDFAEKKELNLHGYTKDYIRDVERKMERKELVSVEDVLSELKEIVELKKEFSGDNWREVEKEVKKMIK